MVFGLVTVSPVVVSPFVILALIDSTVSAQDAAVPDRVAMEGWLREYEQVFADADAKKVAEFWATDAEWSDEAGDRVTGRDALLEDFQSFFANHPGARMRTKVDHVQPIAPGVLGVDGQTLVSLPTDEFPSPPTKFTAVVIKQEGKWRLSRVRELPVEIPATPRMAMTELEFLVGQWRDQTEEVDVLTSVRWSEGDAFLIRSYTISQATEEAQNSSISGTEVIGYDPILAQIKSWTFDSDGSFGSGTWTRDGNQWLHRLSQTTSAGNRISAIQIVKVVDDQTLEISTVGQEIDGVPQPASDPVRVVRVPEEVEDTTASIPTEINLEVNTVEGR